MTTINSAPTVKYIIDATDQSSPNLTGFANTLVGLGLHEDATLDDVRYFVAENSSSLRSVLGKNKDAYRDLLAQLGESGPPPADRNVLAARTQAIRGPAGASGETPDSPFIQDFLGALETRVIGHAGVKQGLKKVMINRESARPGRKSRPTTIGLSGPPGTGKSEFAKAVALAVHGDAKKHILIDCTQISRSEDLNKIFGPPPGYAGAADGTYLLTPQKLRDLFGDRVNEAVFLIDEPDKMPPAVQTEFFNRLTTVLDNGEFKTTLGEEIDFRKAFFFLASNAGDKDVVDGSSEEDKEKHYGTAFTAMLPSHIQSRCSNTFYAGAHSHDSLRKIADLNLHGIFREATEAMAEEGVHVTGKVDDDALTVLATMGNFPKKGARPLVQLIENNVQIMIDRAMTNGDDLSEYTLSLKGKLTPESAEVKALIKAFQKADGGSLGIDIRDIFEMKLTGYEKQFSVFGYENDVGQVTSALDFGTDAVYHAGGTVGGRGFTLYNDGFGSNEMAILTAGAADVGAKGDKLRSVQLPDKLALAVAGIVSPIQAVSIDDNRVLMLGLTLRSKANPVNASSDKLAIFGAQQQLEDLGFPIQGGPSTTYGKEMENAVKQLQKENGIAETGELDENTMSCLFPMSSQCAFIYDCTAAKGKQFTEISAPRKPLIDGTLAMCNGAAVMWGGRPPLWDEDGNLTVDPLTDLNGEAAVPSAYVLTGLDTDKPTWKSQKIDPAKDADAASVRPRTGMSVVAVDDQLWYIGGDTSTALNTGYVASETKRNVTIVDTKSWTASEGPSLPVATAYGSAFKDADGLVVVMGGLQMTQNSGAQSALTGVYKVDPHAENPAWRTRAPLPALYDGSEPVSSKMCVIGSRDRLIVGPVESLDGAPPYFLSYGAPEGAV
jgi:hypothetical protein